MFQVKVDTWVAQDTTGVVLVRAGKWQQRQVEQKTIDVSMAGESGDEVTQADRKVSLDSGIGSTSSIGAVDHQDAQLIVSGLERTYRELVACPAQLKYLLAVRQAIERSSSGICGLNRFAQGVAEVAGRILAWCEHTAVVPIPASLASKLKRSHQLRLRSDALTRQVDLKCTASNLKKALRKNEQLMHFNLHQLRPAQLEYDRAIHTLIDQQPAVHELRNYLQSIRALLPDDVGVSAPVDTAVCTWAYNILLERARVAAGIHN